MNEENGVYGWNETVDVSDLPAQTEQVILPPGTYDFEVRLIERLVHTKKENGKLPTCPMAKVHILVRSEEYGDQRVIKNLFLHSSCKQAVCSFFRSVGLREHGTKLTYKWGEAEGATGKCRIETHVYKEKKSNEISWFVDTEKAAVPAFTEGEF